MQKGLWFGDREQMSMYLSDDATVDGESAFEAMKTAARMHERVGLEIVLPDAFSVLQTAAS